MLSRLVSREECSVFVNDSEVDIEGGDWNDVLQNAMETKCVDRAVETIGVINQTDIAVDNRYHGLSF